MRIGKSFAGLVLQFSRLVLITSVLFVSTRMFATRAAHPTPQANCPSQADCDRLKQISDTAAAASAAAQAVLNQAQADRQKDLSDADRLDREGEFPSGPLAKDMRTSEKL